MIINVIEERQFIDNRSYASYVYFWGKCTLSVSREQWHPDCSLFHDLSESIGNYVSVRFRKGLYPALTNCADPAKIWGVSWITSRGMFNKQGHIEMLRWWGSGRILSSLKSERLTHYRLRDLAGHGLRHETKGLLTGSDGVKLWRHRRVQGIAK
jgi:hypothetical protein